MPRPQLYIHQILAWADLHFEQTGKWPSNNRVRVRGAIDEVWGNIDACLHNGLRGLPPRDSLAKLLARRRGKRNHMDLSRLTLRQILQWADAHFARLGRWPIRASGPVGGAKGESWSAIDLALIQGHRGLPGGNSLSRLLAEKRGVRHPFRQPQLSVKQILAWADAYHARTGKWPISSSGPVGTGTDEKWSMIDNALRHGRRGLPANQSLHRLLLRYRGVPPPKPVRESRARLSKPARKPRRVLGPAPLHKPPLSMDEIMRWIDAFHARTGKWPSTTGGLVGPLAKVTWAAIDHALARGGRGLPGGSSLAKLLAEKRAVPNPAQTPRLSVPQVLAWADAYHARTGNWPVAESGPVGPSSSESWMKINKALNYGLRGLPGGLSLAKLLAEHRGVSRYVRKCRLTIDLVLHWADAHHARTGRWPDYTCGPIPEGNGETWKQVNSALRNGKRGLPAGMTLARLWAERRGARNKAELPKFSEAQILAWADAYHTRRRKWPNYNSGKIAGTNGETWRAVNQALFQGLRGLPGGNTLAKLLTSKRGVPHRRYQPRLTIRQVVAWADAYHDRMGKWPTKASDRVGPYSKETWSRIDDALRNGYRGLPGGQSLYMVLVDRRRAARTAGGLR